MNPFKLLFGNKIWNAPMLQKVCDDNNKDLILLQGELEEKLGYTVNDEVIRQIALKRLLECYTTDEIIEVLRHFKQLKQGD